MDDIIALLKVLRVINTPSSWDRAKRLLSKLLKLTAITHCVCPVCAVTTDNEKQCTTSSSAHNCRLLYFRSFSITQQIANIIISNDPIHLLYDSKSAALPDLRDGTVFRSLREKSNARILTPTRWGCGYGWMGGCVLFLHIHTYTHTRSSANNQWKTLPS